jgi:hypothetical protein
MSATSIEWPFWCIERRSSRSSRPDRRSRIPCSVRKRRGLGVADIPITYDPPVNDPAELKIEQQAQPDGPDLVRCWQRQAPARRLANLANIPAAIITTEASYHAVYDHCTAKYLAQAGIPVTAFRLGDQGIHGNAHMVMLEKNNLQVAGLIARCRFRARAPSILPVSPTPEPMVCRLPAGGSWIRTLGPLATAETKSRTMRARCLGTCWTSGS